MTSALSLVKPASGWGGAAELGNTAGLGNASELAADRVLPVRRELQELLPRRGLCRGNTVVVRASGAGSARADGIAAGRQGATALLLALLTAASRAGAWIAVAGMPQLGLAAARELGIALDRLALLPYPGPQWQAVTAALIDGFDIVVANPGGSVSPNLAARLAARARQRGSVLVPFGPEDWPGADVTLSAEHTTWYGLGRGWGRLRCQELVVAARGRGMPRRATLWLPGKSEEHPRGPALQVVP